jgi:CRP-like cAMP-binding protein
MPALACSIERQKHGYPLAANKPLLMPIEHVSKHNQVLRALPNSVLDRISPHLVPVELPQGTMLYEAGAPINYVYFPVNSIVSLLQVMQNGDTVQTAMVGSEGMAGVGAFMGCPIAPGCAMMQTSGLVLKLRATLLVREFERRPETVKTLLRYTQTLFVQFAQTAVCNRHHSIENQVCRWLLATLDRQPANVLFVTHELIARMIGVRREGITETIGVLENLGIINRRRGQIVIADRPALERHACECYAAVRDQTRSLLPTHLS